ncbi:SOH1-domain-containing protein [Umbelopsis sp. PMI_123]|nr:SOH1-domain-containing protein [Umbelopsis sp. PMI_123]
MSTPLELSDDEQQRRFRIELEFVQCLANPWYLNYLAQQQYFQDPAFINYLKYLQYWKSPEYAKYIVYPHALHFLDLLQHPQFREHVITAERTQDIHKTQYYHWMYYRKPITEIQGEQQLPILEGAPPSLDNSNELHLKPSEFVNSNNNGNDQISMQSQ